MVLPGEGLVMFEVELVGGPYHGCRTTLVKLVPELILPVEQSSAVAADDVFCTEYGYRCVRYVATKDFIYLWDRVAMVAIQDAPGGAGATGRDGGGTAAG